MNTFHKFFAFTSLFFVLNANAEQIESQQASSTAAKNGLEQELAELKQLFSNGNKEQQMLSINRRIRFSGITDVTLFDIAEKNMLGIPRGTQKREDTQYVAWMAQMLAFSGQEKYVPTLKNFLSGMQSDTIKQHATSSLEVLPKYQRWNVIISQNLENIPASGLARARLFNMLNSDDPELIRGAASIADHFYLADEEVTDLVEKRLLALYPKATNLSTDQYAEASSWLCKILGHTRKQKYISTLTQILNSTKVPALHRWAKKALDNFSTNSRANLETES